MRLDQALADRQSEPGASLEAGAPAEEARQLVGRDPASLVTDRDRDVHAVAHRLDPDRRGLGRAARRVREQVVQHLHDALAVRATSALLWGPLDGGIRHGEPGPDRWTLANREAGDGRPVCSPPVESRRIVRPRDRLERGSGCGRLGGRNGL